MLDLLFTRLNLTILPLQPLLPRWFLGFNSPLTFNRALKIGFAGLKTKTRKRESLKTKAKKKEKGGDEVGFEGGGADPQALRKKKVRSVVRSSKNLPFLHFLPQD